MDKLVLDFKIASAIEFLEQMSKKEIFSFEEVVELVSSTIILLEQFPSLIDDMNAKQSAKVFHLRLSQARDNLMKQIADRGEIKGIVDWLLPMIKAVEELFIEAKTIVDSKSKSQQNVVIGQEKATMPNGTVSSTMSTSENGNQVVVNSMKNSSETEISSQQPLGTLQNSLMVTGNLVESSANEKTKEQAEIALNQETINKSGRANEFIAEQPSNNSDVDKQQGGEEVSPEVVPPKKISIQSAQDEGQITNKSEVDNTMQAEQICKKDGNIGGFVQAETKIQSNVVTVDKISEEKENEDPTQNEENGLKNIMVPEILKDLMDEEAEWQKKVNEMRKTLFFAQYEEKEAEKQKKEYEKLLEKKKEEFEKSKEELETAKTKMVEAKKECDSWEKNEYACVQVQGFPLHLFHRPELSYAEIDDKIFRWIESLELRDAHIPENCLSLDYIKVCTVFEDMNKPSNNVTENSTTQVFLYFIHKENAIKFSDHINNKPVTIDRYNVHLRSQIAPYVPDRDQFTR